MNSTHKRAIGTTPFNIMFGRQSRYIDLLEYVQVTDNENYNNEEDNPDADEQATFNVQNEMDNQMLDFNTEREDSWNEARESIIREQLKQKRIFDEKVHEKR